MVDYNTEVPRAQIHGKLRKFDNIITVAKTGYGDYVCTDPTYATDSACIQAALDHISSLGGGTLYLQGHFICPTQLVYTGSDLTIIGDDANTILDFSSVATNISCVYAHGSISATNSLLTVAGTAGDLTITVADGTKFAAGDWIRIRSEAIFQPRPHVTDPWNQKLGEIQQIKSIAGNVITLYERLLGSYALADTATVDKMNMLENISIKNLRMIGNPAAYQYGINITQAHNISIENVQFQDMVDRAANVTDCVGVQYHKNIIKRSNRASLGYGLAILNACRDINASKNHGYDCRHLITCGGDHTHGIQYNQVWAENTQSYDSQGSGMFGPHPSADGLTIVNNICNGCSLGYIASKNTLVANNNVQNTDVTSPALWVAEAGENVAIKGNIIQGIATAISIRTHFGGMQIDGNKIICTGSAGDAAGIIVLYQSNKIKISKNDISTLNSPITFVNTDGYEDSTDISIENNTISWVNNGPGIFISGTTYNYNKVNISDNILTASGSPVGIYVKKVDENNGVNSKITISNNKCHGGAVGITVKDSDKVSIDNNKIYDAPTGISIPAAVSKYAMTENKFYDCTTPINDIVMAADRIVTNNPSW